MLNASPLFREPATLAQRKGRHRRESSTLAQQAFGVWVANSFGTRLLGAVTLGVVAIALLPASAVAQKAPNAKSVVLANAKSVVLAPVSSLSVAKPTALVAIEKTIESGLSTISGVQLVTARSAVAQAKKAKRPELRTCDGDVACLAALGKLVSAKYTVYAEVGGLGDAQVVYLKLIDVASAKEIRSTLIELSSLEDAKAKSIAAATRLLTPESYAGILKIATPVPGAIIYLDGQKRGTTPAKPISVAVGSHALRVTHPEHRDYVRFIDIDFGKETAIDAELKSLPGVEQRLSIEGVIGGKSAPQGPQGPYSSTPWYLRWYTITGGVVVVGITSAIIFGALGGDLDFEAEKHL